MTSSCVQGSCFTFICFLSMYLLPQTGYSRYDDSVAEKRVELAMRMIGHEVLMSGGDCDSRVLPIKKLDNRYQISFEKDFGFDPEELISIVDYVMAETQIAPSLLVETQQCETKEVVHIFEISRDHPDVLSCNGRVLPKDCYQLFVTIYDPSAASDLPVITADKDSSFTVGTGLFFGVPIVLILGFIFYTLKKRTTPESDPNLVLIGESQFDTKHLALSYDNKTIDLSHKEAELLTLLHTSANQTIEREVILKEVWGDEGDYVGRTLDVFISKLRKKLGADTSIKIVNIRGVGYKLVS